MTDQPTPSKNQEEPSDGHAAGTVATTRTTRKPVDLLKDPLWKALLFMALPATIGFFFNTLYNVVDLFFARSWNGPEGASTQDAMGATFPLFFLMLAFGTGLYQGTTSLVANAYGKGDIDKVRTLTVQAVIYGLLVGLGISALGLLLLTPILQGVQGLEGVEFRWAAGYMIAVFAGAPLIVANFALYALLSGSGNNRAFGLSLMLSFLLNILFNYIFMHIFGWGLVGLGISTVLMQGPLNFLYALFEIRLLGTLRGLPRTAFRLHWPLLRQVASQALPATLSMLLVALSLLITNAFAGFYASGTLGGLSAGARIEQIMLLPIIGVGISSLAIIGQNQGAGQIDRVKAIFWLTTKVILTMTITASLLIFSFREPLAALIATPGREAQVATEYLFFAGFGTVFFGLLYAGTSFKTGMRQPLFSAYANALRLIVFPLILIPIFMTLTPDFLAIPWATLAASVVVGTSTYAWVARSVVRLSAE